MKRSTPPLIALFVLTSISGCDSRLPESMEVHRLTAPNGKVDAVLYEGSNGATDSYEYQIFLTPKSSAPTARDRVVTLYAATRNAQAYGVNMKWEAIDVLSVQYLQADSARIEHSPFLVDKQHINIQLASGVLDPHAPPGGMRFNNEKQKNGQNRNNL